MPTVTTLPEKYVETFNQLSTDDQLFEQQYAFLRSALLSDDGQPSV